MPQHHRRFSGDGHKRATLPTFALRHCVRSYVGCVRATAVDAFILNYRVVLAEEGCFDRSDASHAVSLCDMHAKYADVMKVADVLTYLDTIPAGQFDLPKGSGQSKAARPLARE